MRRDLWNLRGAADTVVSESSTRDFSYDANGNVALDDRDGTVYTLAYKDTNRLGGVLIDGSPTATYLLNSLGQRVEKTVGADTTRFHYDQDGNLIAETDSTGAVIREYLYADGYRLGMTTGSAPAGLYFVHSDHLGTPQVITDASQSIVWQGDYEPFGRVTPSVETIENPLRFPGQFEDQESGLYYNFFRDYEPAIGRYMEADPAGLGGGLNLYLYVAASPLGYIDVFGLASDDLDQRIENALKQRAALICLRKADELYLRCQAAVLKLAGVCDALDQGFRGATGYPGPAICPDPYLGPEVQVTLREECEPLLYMDCGEAAPKQCLAAPEGAYIALDRLGGGVTLAPTRPQIQVPSLHDILFKETFRDSPQGSQ